MNTIKKSTFLIEYLGKTLPLVRRELWRWQETLRECKSLKLKRLALKSIKEKAFHSIGGAVFSHVEGERCLSLLQFIVAFQTMSDYLDTLCDEGGIYCEKTFRQLHRSMERALVIEENHDDYYSYYPQKEDGGYLESLVERCQDFLRELPNYRMVQDKVLGLNQLYIDLQSLKHLSSDKRERRLIEWYQEKAPIEALSWYEYAAACGSTLALFSLLSLACKKEIKKEEVEAMYNAYFPWVCSLHILLDYLIDHCDDEKMGELNFISYYPHLHKTQERLLYVLETSLRKTSLLPYKKMHQTIIQGLLALYLSDDKAKNINKNIISQLLKKGGVASLFMKHLASVLRRVRYL